MLADRLALATELYQVAEWPLALHRRWLLSRPTPGNALQRLDLGLLAGGQWPMLVWLMLLIVGGGMGAAGLFEVF